MLCLFLLANPSVFATPRHLWLLSQVRRQRLAEGRWVKCWWQPKVQTGFKQTWLPEKCDTLFNGWSDTINNYEITLSLMIWKDENFNQGWRTCLGILEEHFDNSIHKRNSDMLCFCGFLGCEVANKFTAEQLLVCGCQRCTHTSTCRFSHYRSQDLSCNSELPDGVVLFRKKCLAKDESWRISMSKFVYLVPQFSPPLTTQTTFPTCAVGNLLETQLLDVGSGSRRSLMASQPFVGRRPLPAWGWCGMGGDG